MINRRASFSFDEIVYQVFGDVVFENLLGDGKWAERRQEKK